MKSQRKFDSGCLLAKFPKPATHLVQSIVSGLRTIPRSQGTMRRSCSQSANCFNPMASLALCSDFGRLRKRAKVYRPGLTFLPKWLRSDRSPILRKATAAA